MNKTAFVSGVTGQDGAYLSKYLLDLGYKVTGGARRSAERSFWRLKKMDILDKIEIVEFDLLDYTNMVNVIRDGKFDEIYNLAAQSFVGTSFKQPLYTLECNGLAVCQLLDIVKTFSPESKFYQASTSEMFGEVKETPQNEYTPFNPSSPYGVAKLMAHNFCEVYREAYDMYVCTGILFNHESSFRPDEFVTKKITNYVRAYKEGKVKETLKLGNINSERDWGFAGDYCINKDVPILTPSGWKFFNELEVGDEIINFDAVENILSRDTINQIYEPNIKDSKKYHMTGRSTDITCTPHHRFYYQKKSVNSKGGWSGWKVCTAEELYEMFKDKSVRTKYNFRFPHFQGYNAEDNTKFTDDEIYLIGMLLTEGYCDETNRTSRVSLSQSKLVNKETYEKIKDVLRSLNLEFRKRDRNDGVTEWIFNSESSREILGLFDTNDIHTMPTWCYSLSRRQSTILFESMMDGDGHWGSNTYKSKRRDLAASFQTICCLAGLQTTGVHKQKGGCYTVTAIASNKKYSYIQDINVIDDGVTDVWCVNTNNGTIVSRDSEKVTISGNCKAMYMMMQLDNSGTYVIGTGKKYSVRDFVNMAFDAIGIDVEWEGKGIDEKGKDKETGELLVEISEKFYRPFDVETLLADNRKAKRYLLWKPETKIDELVKMMVNDEV